VFDQSLQRRSHLQAVGINLQPARASSNDRNSIDRYRSSATGNFSVRHSSVAATTASATAANPPTAIARIVSRARTNGRTPSANSGWNYLSGVVREAVLLSVS